MSAPGIVSDCRLWAQDALLPQGWAREVLLQWDAAGTFTQVESGVPAPAGVERAAGPLLPGMPNVHSHAFQRAFAGLTEWRGKAPDSFWSWRRRMYAFANRITPEALEAIALWVYLEMLDAGYTSVCEFHYLHHDAGGRPYADDATMSLALLRAAHKAGMGMTLLPVLYQTSGFGVPPAPEQARFIRSTDKLLALVQRLAPIAQSQGAALGLAPHSLRAVPPASLEAGVAGLHALLPKAPVHIHVAEQRQEVRDCIAWSGQRPAQWLLDHAPVDARWCLVHATHMAPGEYAAAARSGAVVGLCPSTEANLGDGIFNLPRWLRHGGRWGVGSDSQVCVNAAEELMLLEYGQRLQRRRRNVLASAGQPHTATAMLLQAVAGGAQATGRAVAGLQSGQQADFVMLDPAHIALRGLAAEYALAGHVFASARSSAVQQVWVAGQQRLLPRHHTLRTRAEAAFERVRWQLLQA
ncbi:formimidoylglutamate deiminase [Comamonas endophytica]|uniref:Formimidoylglutamate deiminase n=1 Tax=Comamonas endophytica TaxID=2949090 RepID=A0ABY6GB03_9BURK|nr:MULTISPECIES: formimidoylglutamate deiminase [unclassified Acidovorax]MCD2513891.1 formimidoylglutamate deiminase [Acidovorax sp. D4N7]UYG52113.1 formimidoylglutamate deiminase [Acidovorax sp. 5MLIR]